MFERAANGVVKRGGGGEGAVGKQYLTNTSMGSPKTKARNRSNLFFVSNLAGYERECVGNLGRAEGEEDPALVAEDKNVR